MKALTELDAALDAQFPEEPVEELKRLVTDLKVEIHESNGATSAKLDALIAEQRIISERVTRIEEREKACSEGNRLGHTRIWDEIGELKTDAKLRERESAKGRRSMIASIVAAIAAVGAAAVAALSK